MQKKSPSSLSPLLKKREKKDKMTPTTSFVPLLKQHMSVYKGNNHFSRENMSAEQATRKSEPKRQCL